MTRDRLFRLLVLPFAAALLVTGCDTSLTPFDEDTGLYSVYGYLTLSQNRHFLRVKDLTAPLSSDSTRRTLDAAVTLTNVATGQRETLTDSIVTFDQVFTHNFRTDQDIHPGTTYRLTIEHPNGGATRATATTPRSTEVEVVPLSDTVKCDEGITFQFRGISGESRVQISGAVVWDTSLRWTRSDLRVPEGDSVFTTGGYLPWRIVQEVVPKAVWAPIQEKKNYCNVLDEKIVRIAYTHFGPGWPADSVLGNPAQSTVENGLGVFSGLRRDTLTRVLTRN